MGVSGKENQNTLDFQTAKFNRLSQRASDIATGKAQVTDPNELKRLVHAVEKATRRCLAFKAKAEKEAQGKKSN